jgi:hypothetical protein
MGLVTLAAVLMATSLGGRRYLYCRAMDRIMTEGTCCGGAHDDPGFTAGCKANDCFDVRTLDRLSSATVPSDHAIAPASLVGFLSDAAVDAFVSSNSGAHGEPLIRAGPYSPAGARAQLMVFLT